MFDNVAKEKRSSGCYFWIGNGSRSTSQKCPIISSPPCIFDRTFLRQHGNLKAMTGAPSAIAN